MIRRSGQTTRIVDNLIQELFTTGECRPYDHYISDNNSQNRKLSIMVADIVIRRLTFEHPRVKFEKAMKDDRPFIKLIEGTYEPIDESEMKVEMIDREVTKKELDLVNKLYS